MAENTGTDWTSKIFDLGANMMQGGANAATSRNAAREEKSRYTRQVEEQERIQAAREAAYANVQKNAGEQFKTGEAGFLQEASTNAPEIAQMKADVAAGATEGQQIAAGNLGAQLQKTGTRGPQAAMIQAEQSGKMGADLNKDINQYAMEQLRARRGYQEAKAGRGQAGTLTQAAF